jgi:hypothetical protein
MGGRHDNGSSSAIWSTARHAVLATMKATSGALLLLCTAVTVAGAAAGGEVHGTVYTEFKTENSPIQALLPDISVYVVNQSTSARSVAVKTDFDGAFAIEPRRLRVPR